MKSTSESNVRTRLERLGLQRNGWVWHGRHVEEGRREADDRSDICRGLDAIVDAAGRDSFPASDPPGWTPTHLGPPSDLHVGPEMFHDVVQRMRDDVCLLSETLGERNDRSPRAVANLERAAFAIEERFREAGLPVRRRRVNEWASNIEAVIRGRDLAGESIVIGAPYDTARGSPGADDNASGVATLIALAHHLQGIRLSRTVRLVALAAEHAPHAGTDSAGSARYLHDLSREGPRVVAMVGLSALGAYSTVRRRWPLRLVRWLRADLAMIGDRRSRTLITRSKRAFDSAASDIAVASIASPFLLGGTRLACHHAFSRAGIPAFTMTDAEVFHRLGSRRRSDTADRLDFERLGRATLGLREVVKQLAAARAPRG